MWWIYEMLIVVWQKHGWYIVDNPIIHRGDAGGVFNMNGMSHISNKQLKNSRNGQGWQLNSNIHQQIYIIYISTWSGNYVNLQLVTDGFSLCLDLGGLNQRHHRWSIRGLSSNMAGKSPANEAFMGNTLINGRLASQFWLNSWTELNCWFGFMQKWVNPMGFDSSSQGDLGYSQPPNI